VVAVVEQVHEESVQEQELVQDDRQDVAAEAEVKAFVQQVEVQEQK